MKSIAISLAFAPFTTTMLFFESTHSIPTFTNATILVAKFFRRDYPSIRWDC